MRPGEIQVLTAAFRQIEYQTGSLSISPSVLFIAPIQSVREDDSLAPPGKHVMSLFCQHYNYDLPDGMNRDVLKEQVADEIINFVTLYAPNLKSVIVGRRVLSPLDLERDFGLVRGDIMHGNLGLDQIYAMHPTSGAADYRMPLKNLYLCGSGAHPGGGVSGCPGHNAAREIIHDLRWRRNTA
jgi:phytoene dehydrogenase-like protein